MVRSIYKMPIWKTWVSETSGLNYKCFMIVIYDHNDSGQDYKTTITIIIDDPCLF
jgi:hypothetical protein